MKIELENYSDQWPNAFETEKEKLVKAAGKWLFGTIEHIGSTSVPGLLAKPIIDIMFGVKTLHASKSAIKELSAIDYCYYPYKAEVMHWFCKPSPEHRTHHLHLIPYQSDLWFERLRFRDILRKDADLASEYASLKVALARENPFDREEYTDRKWPFIKGVLGSCSHS